VVAKWEGELGDELDSPDAQATDVLPQLAAKPA